MKTAKQVLDQWVLNQVHFDGGRAGSEQVWTRDEIEILAAYLAGKNLPTAKEAMLGLRVNWNLASNIRDAMTVFGMSEQATGRWVAGYEGLDEIGQIRAEMKIGNGSVSGFLGTVRIHGAEIRR